MMSPPAAANTIVAWLSAGGRSEQEAPEERGYHGRPMRLPLLFAVLLLICGTATACATGLSGAAVGAPPPKTPGTPIGVNLLPNTSFTAGTAPWLSNEAANLSVASLPVPSPVLMLEPTTPGGVFSAKVVVTTTPSESEKYSFEGLVKGSPDLVGTPVQVILGALEMTSPTTGQMVTMAQKSPRLGRHWRHFSVTGLVPNGGASNVTAIVAVQSRSKHSWLALDSVDAELLRTKPTRPQHSRS